MKIPDATLRTFPLRARVVSWLDEVVDIGMNREWGDRYPPDSAAPVLCGAVGALDHVAHKVHNLSGVAEEGFALVGNGLDSSVVQIALTIVQDNGEQKRVGLSHAEKIAGAADRWLTAPRIGQRQQERQ